MSDMMTFPDTWEEFEKSYGFTDNEEVYTNGARLIPSFRVKQWLDHLPSVQPTRTTPSNTLDALESIQTTQLTDDDKETIRIHLNAFKESLCNQGRWYEEYEELIYRLLSPLSVQPERKKGKWIRTRTIIHDGELYCDQCEQEHPEQKKIWKFCPNCGADMRPQFEEPEINPCRGCEDYDGKGGCKSKGGCADRRGEQDG